MGWRSRTERVPGLAFSGRTSLSGALVALDDEAPPVGESDGIGDLLGQLGGAGLADTREAGLRGEGRFARCRQGGAALPEYRVCGGTE